MWTDILHRLRAVFRRHRVEQELDDELQFHIRVKPTSIQALDGPLRKRRAGRGSTSVDSTRRRNSIGIRSASLLSRGPFRI